MREFAARRTLGFTESVIREMTRLCLLYQGSEALNLAQGFPDFPAPEPVKEAAFRAIRPRREYMLAMLARAGFRCFAPDGAYYVMADISAFGYPNDLEFAHHLVRDVGFAVVPGSSCYRGEGLGSQRARFCFAKNMETLRRVDKLLGKIEPYAGR